MRTLVLTLALLFATSAYAEQRSLSGSEQPTEAVKSEAKASEAKSEAKSDEKKKPVAKKHETDEEKARRIAKRYGVTW
jgi:hypothetical protein